MRRCDAQPSCSQKRTLLFSEYLTERLLLRLLHRQFVFSFPKALRVFFKHDRRLFSEVSRLLFDVIQSFYDEVAGRPIRTAAVLAYQSYGDLVQSVLSRAHSRRRLRSSGPLRLYPSQRPGSDDPVPAAARGQVLSPEGVDDFLDNLANIRFRMIGVIPRAAVSRRYRSDGGAQTHSPKSISQNLGGEQP